MHPVQDHPFRQAIDDELHARPVALVPDQARIRRLIFVVMGEAGGMGAVFEAFCDFVHIQGLTPPAQDRRQYSFEAGTRYVSWEFHTEFITVTWRTGLEDAEPWPDDIGLHLLGTTLIIGATRIDLISETEVPRSLLPGFSPTSLCLVDIDSGKAQVATDFVADSDRFIRFEVAATALTPLRRSIIIRRLLEVETYRCMALLGLPLAREVSVDLGKAEMELTTVVQTLSNANSTEKVHEALLALHGLSVRSGQLSERTSYRFAASKAYGDILGQRLAGLREQAATQGASLSSYIGNRVGPALATCDAMEKRLNVLSDKIERAIGLLDVRIGLDMQIQNKAVLQNIAQTANSQFLLQRTVEGLSTIAISYYALGIIGYALADPLQRLDIDKTLALSIAAPFVVLVVWLTGRAIRKAHKP